MGQVRGSYKAQGFALGYGSTEEDFVLLSRDGENRGEPAVYCVSLYTR